MAMTKKLQVYETPQIAVSFDPNVCRHTGVCVRSLPAVFDVRRARWIRPELEPADEVAAAVQKCPSGALQFYRNLDRNPAAAARLARRVLANELALCLAETGTREARAGAICSAIARTRGYDYVGLYDVLPREIAAVGWSGNTPPAHPVFERERGLCGVAVRTSQTQIVNDVAEDSNYITTSAATQAEMIVPVVDPASREVVGTIDVASNRRDAFGGDDRDLVEECGRVILSFWTEQA
jgi:putative methionine-R-sulfoxide reductase with GAF domain/uncharacterized Fe-S cluster protein YjdI